MHFYLKDKNLRKFFIKLLLEELIQTDKVSITEFVCGKKSRSTFSVLMTLILNSTSLWRQLRHFKNWIYPYWTICFASSLPRFWEFHNKISDDVQQWYTRQRCSCFIFVLFVVSYLFLYRSLSIINTIHVLRWLLGLMLVANMSFRYVLPELKTWNIFKVNLE